MRVCIYIYILVPCDNYALTTYAVHARFYPFAYVFRTFHT